MPAARDPRAPAPIRLSADAAGLDTAAARLVAGRLVALPTETVYGLGADATNGTAVAAVYAAKGRPRFNPLIAHVADRAAAEALVALDPVAAALADRFWPGPLTIVAPKRAGCPVSDLASAGLDTLAVRVPDHPVARALLARVARPVAAPSANRSGGVSPTEAAHVLEEMAGRDVAVLDGGPTRVGLESTIVRVVDGVVHLLRPGGVPRAMIEAAAGAPVAVATEPSDDPARPVAPGMLLSHYAPRAAVRLDVTEPVPGAAHLGFGPLPAWADPARSATLSAGGDLAEAAANLFRLLRRLDATGAPLITVAPVPADGLGEAIRDRLARAAAPRPAAPDA